MFDRSTQLGDGSLHEPRVILLVAFSYDPFVDKGGSAKEQPTAVP